MKTRTLFIATWICFEPTFQWPMKTSQVAPALLGEVCEKIIWPLRSRWGRSFSSDPNRCMTFEIDRPSLFTAIIRDMSVFNSGRIYTNSSRNNPECKQEDDGDCR